MNLSANIKYSLDNVGNSCDISKVIRGALELLEGAPIEIGSKTIFGEIVTAEIQIEQIELRKSRAADLLAAVAAELRK